MGTTIRVSLFILLVFIGLETKAGETRAGFFLPDDVSEVTLRFETINSLIVLPVVINDSVKVNLILDTGCRNLVLFGKRFQKFFNTEPDKKIKFSGLGNGNAIEGQLSLNNKVSMSTVIGEQIPVVLISEKNLFALYPNIHGVIGYDIFIKFEIELNPQKQIVTFRPAATAILNAEYQKIPIRIDDSRPIVASQLFFSGSRSEACDLMLDTGSALGLLVKTSDVKKFSKHSTKTKLGRGFNGSVIGIEAMVEKLLLNTMEISGLQASITYSVWHTYASVGMAVLEDYAVVLNYCQSYAGFKKLL
jgi:hypothetical protein